MKYYKSPKTRIKVIQITKNEGSEKCEYTPQVKNKYWFFYWLLLPLLPIIIFLDIISLLDIRFQPHHYMILSKGMINGIRIYKTINQNQSNFIQNDTAHFKGSLMYAKIAIDIYLQNHKLSWLVAISEKQVSYISYPPIKTNL